MLGISKRGAAYLRKLLVNGARALLRHAKDRGDGKMWLTMLNLDMLINSELLPAEMAETAIRVNQQMLDVMTAGASDMT